MVLHMRRSYPAFSFWYPPVCNRYALVSGPLYRVHSYAARHQQGVLLAFLLFSDLHKFLNLKRMSYP
jgi:hypothetical protein